MHALRCCMQYVINVACAKFGMIGLNENTRTDATLLHGHVIFDDYSPLSVPPRAGIQAPFRLITRDLLLQAKFDSEVGTSNEDIGDANRNASFWKELEAYQSLIAPLQENDAQTVNLLGDASQCSANASINTDNVPTLNGRLCDLIHGAICALRVKLEDPSILLQARGEPFPRKRNAGKRVARKTVLKAANLARRRTLTSNRISAHNIVAPQTAVLSEFPSSRFVTGQDGPCNSNVDGSDNAAFVTPTGPLTPTPGVVAFEDRIRGKRRGGITSALSRLLSDGRNKFLTASAPHRRRRMGRDAVDALSPLSTVGPEEAIVEEAVQTINADKVEVTDANTESAEATGWDPGSLIKQLSAPADGTENEWQVPFIEQVGEITQIAEYLAAVENASVSKRAFDEKLTQFVRALLHIARLFENAGAAAILFCIVFPGPEEESILQRLEAPLHPSDVQAPVRSASFNTEFLSYFDFLPTISPELFEELNVTAAVTLMRSAIFAQLQQTATLGAVVTPIPLQKGDHIYREIKPTGVLKLLQHHGVYVGNGRVLHFSGNENAVGTLLGGGAAITTTSILRFVKSGSRLRLRRYRRQVLPPSETVYMAETALIEQNYPDYSFFANNCEHFCEWVKTGVARSRQINTAATVAAAGAALAATAAVAVVMLNSGKR